MRLISYIHPECSSRQAFKYSTVTNWCSSSTPSKFNICLWWGRGYDLYVSCSCCVDHNSRNTSPWLLVHSWNVHFTLLQHAITELALGPKQPVYSVIIDCDRKIRDFEVPVQWRISADDDSLPLDVAMYRWLVLSTKETGNNNIYLWYQSTDSLCIIIIALLSLHRGYFAQSLQESPGDLQRHRHLPSVVAVYRSAWRIIRGLATTWRIIPKFLSRVSSAWSHGLSSAVGLPIHSVKCSILTCNPLE